jgi:hypothetical protein
LIAWAFFPGGIFKLFGLVLDDRAVDFNAYLCTAGANLTTTIILQLCTTPAL